MLRPYTDTRPTPTEGLTPLPFVPFELERWQSTWENRVRYNLSESGVHPLSIHELLELAGASPAPLLDVRLGYSQSRSEEHTSELQSLAYLVCRLLLEKKKHERTSGL